MSIPFASASLQSPGLVKYIFDSAVGLLNHPTVKTAIIDISGIVALAFATAEIYDLIKISKGRQISTEMNNGSPPWIQAAKKISIIGAKISLILSGIVSRPGAFLISTLVGRIFSTTQLNRVFGLNTTFAANPWHPRHVISIAAVIFAIPSLLESTYHGVRWAHRKVCGLQQAMQTSDGKRQWLTDEKVRMMVLFNSITSRPVLHIANQWAHALSRKL